MHLFCQRPSSTYVLYSKKGLAISTRNDRLKSHVGQGVPEETSQLVHPGGIACIIEDVAEGIFGLRVDSGTRLVSWGSAGSAMYLYIYICIYMYI